MQNLASCCRYSNSPDLIEINHGGTKCAVGFVGFVATTNAGGAEAPWLPEFSEALAGREVIVIPDNDKPGRDRAARIARALIGRVTRLVLLELEGAKDVTEWFDRGHGELELIELVEKELAATA